MAGGARTSGPGFAAIDPEDSLSWAEGAIMRRSSAEVPVTGAARRLSAGVRNRFDFSFSVASGAGDLGRSAE